MFRFTTSVFPSEDDHVVTSPYNAMMSLSKLIEHADCVLPLENQALLDICRILENRARPGGASSVKSGKAVWRIFIGWTFCAHKIAAVSGPPLHHAPLHSDCYHTHPESWSEERFEVVE